MKQTTATAYREQLSRREVEDRLYRAIRTLAALPDAESRYLANIGNTFPDVVLDAAEAYGWTEATVRGFRPTRSDIDMMLPTLDWLAWLSRQNDGRRDVRIVSARAYALPWWRLAGRFGRSERTVQRWHDDAIAAVHEKFGRCSRILSHMSDKSLFWR